MSEFHLSDMTWTEVAALDSPRIVAILPLGAVEAHGPHLPISTDRIIAEAMAEDGARRLAEHACSPLILPTIDYTAASFASAFAGTISLRPETVSALLLDIATALASQGITTLALVNAHLDPGHLTSIYAAIETIRRATPLTVVFPDLTRKPWALRMSDEFKSGACHAGQYEGSVVMARRPELVHEDRQRQLPVNPRSLSTAIRDGLSSFEEAGGPQAYFGDPAAATAAEGHETIAIMGRILEQAVLAALDSAA